MDDVLDELITRYEQRKCDRRQLLAVLGALLATGGPAAAVAASPEPPFRCRELNHVTLRVSDLARSKEFYAKLLGARVIKEDKDTCYLSLGRGFLALWHSDERGLDHWCVGVQPFTRTPGTADDGSRKGVRQRLEADGLSLRTDKDDPTIYVHDPDGNVVQLEAPGFKA